MATPVRKGPGGPPFYTFVRWDPRDLWVGLYWDRRKDGVHFYLCPIPCLVFHGVVQRPRPVYWAFWTVLVLTMAVNCVRGILRAWAGL